MYAFSVFTAHQHRREIHITQPSNFENVGNVTCTDYNLSIVNDLVIRVGYKRSFVDIRSNIIILSCLVFNHLREHEDWPHHEPLIATDICLPQLSTVVQLTTLSKM